MDVEVREREKERMGKEKRVIINGKEERGNEKKPENSQKKKYKTGTKTMNLYMASSLEPPTSRLCLLASSFFLLFTRSRSLIAFFLLFSINRGQYLRIGRPTALHRRQQWQLFRQKQMV